MLSGIEFQIDKKDNGMVESDTVRMKWWDWVQLVKKRKWSIILVCIFIYAKWCEQS